MNINFYDLCFTLIKNRDEKEIVKDDYENRFLNKPNHCVGRKNNVVILR